MRPAGTSRWPTWRPGGQPRAGEGGFSPRRRVTAVAFSPDGKTIATGSCDKTARLWNLETGQPIGPTIQHQDCGQGRPSALTAAGSPPPAMTRRLELWDVATGQPISPALEHPAIVFSVAFSPDGRRVLTGCFDGGGRIWDVASGQLVGQSMVHSSLVWSVAFSPDGKTVLTGSWIKRRGCGTPPPAGLSASRCSIRAVLTLRPSARMARRSSPGAQDKTARLWDAATGRPVGKPMEHLDRVRSVAFSPDGKTILTGSWDKMARTWDAASGEPLGVVLEHSGWVNSVAFSPDGKTILTGSSDGTAQLWDAATGRPLGPPLEHPSVVTSVAFSPDARWILTLCGDNTARLWDAATGLPVGPSLPHMLHTRL